MKKYLLLFFLLVLSGCNFNRGSTSSSSSSDTSNSNNSSSSNPPIIEQPFDEELIKDYFGVKFDDENLRFDLLDLEKQEVKFQTNDEINNATIIENQDNYSLFYTIKKNEKVSVFKADSLDKNNLEFKNKELYYEINAFDCMVVSNDPSKLIVSSNESYLYDLKEDTKTIITSKDKLTIQNAFYQDERLYSYYYNSLNELVLVCDNQVQTIVDYQNKSLNKGTSFYHNGIVLTKRNANNQYDYLYGVSSNYANINYYNESILLSNKDSKLINGFVNVYGDNVNQDQMLGLFMFVKEGNINTLQAYKIRQDGLLSIYGNKNSAKLTITKDLKGANYITLNLKTGGDGSLALKVIKDEKVFFEHKIVRCNKTQYKISLSEEAKQAINNDAIIEVTFNDAYLYSVKGEI